MAEIPRTVLIVVHVVVHAVSTLARIIPVLLPIAPVLLRIAPIHPRRAPVPPPIAPIPSPTAPILTCISKKITTSLCGEVVIGFLSIYSCHNWIYVLEQNSHSDWCHAS